MDFVIARHVVRAGSGGSVAQVTTHRVALTVNFTDEELATIRSRRLADTVVYLDPPRRLEGFLEPIRQRLTLQHLVKRRPNTRTFMNATDAAIFETDLRRDVLPLVEDILAGTRLHLQPLLMQISGTAAKPEHNV
jgi:hypothetical protein